MLYYVMLWYGRFGRLFPFRSPLTKTGPSDWNCMISDYLWSPFLFRINMTCTLFCQQNNSSLWLSSKFDMRMFNRWNTEFFIIRRNGNRSMSCWWAHSLQMRWRLVHESRKLAQTLPFFVQALTAACRLYNVHPHTHNSPPHNHTWLNLVT